MRRIIVRRGRYATPDHQAKRHDNDQERHGHRFGRKDDEGGRPTLCSMRPAN
jgi:Zn-finger nucleic acid-binding protein